MDDEKQGPKIPAEIVIAACIALAPRLIPGLTSLLQTHPLVIYICITSAITALIATLCIEVTRKPQLPPKETNNQAAKTTKAPRATAPSPRKENKQQEALPKTPIPQTTPAPAKPPPRPPATTPSATATIPPTPQPPTPQPKQSTEQPPATKHPPPPKDPPPWITPEEKPNSNNDPTPPWKTDDQPTKASEPKELCEGQVISVRWIKQEDGGVKAFASGRVLFIDRNYDGPAPQVGETTNAEVLKVLETSKVAFVQPIIKAESIRPPTRSDIIEQAAQTIRKSGSEPTQEQQTENIDAEALAAILKSRILGQDHAISAITAELRWRLAKNPETNRGSITCMFFVGPTGVGKTELAKQLAKELDMNLIKLEMNTFHSRHDAARLVGSPPGYIGSDTGGQLTRPIREQPRSVVVFDEIEKAHQDVYKALMTIMDEGELTDASDGKTSDFRKSILIFTSNHIADDLTKLAQKTHQDKLEDAMREALKTSNQFLPEWLGRLDRIILFQPLSLEALLQLLQIECRQAAAAVNVKLAPSERDTIVALYQRVCDSAGFGARGIRSWIERTLGPLLLDHRNQHVRLIITKDDKINIKVLN